MTEIRITKLNEKAPARGRRGELSALLAKALEGLEVGGPGALIEGVGEAEIKGLRSAASALPRKMREAEGWKVATQARPEGLAVWKIPVALKGVEEAAQKGGKARKA